MLTLNNNSTSKMMSSSDKYGFENSSSDDRMKNNGGGVLPSFHDILWCPDVDGDVMDTSGMGGAMVRYK